MQILKFKNIDDVIERGNNSVYGLAAAVVTPDIEKALHVAHGLRAGTVWVNCYDVFDSCMPFGGYNMSGSGRELGEYGLQAYTEVKTVSIITTQSKSVLRINRCSSMVPEHLSRVMRKPVFGVSVQVQNKPVCTATEDG